MFGNTYDYDEDGNLISVSEDDDIDPYEWWRFHFTISMKNYDYHHPQKE